MDYFLLSFSPLPLLHCSVVLFTQSQSEVASGDHLVPSSQSRPSFKIRAGCSGPCSAEYLQSWSIYTTSLGNLLQQLTTLKVEKDFIISKQNFPCCNSRPLLLALSLIFLACLVPFSLRPPKRYRKIAVRFPLSFLFSRLRKKSSSLSRSFYLTSFSSLNILFILRKTLFTMLVSFLCWGRWKKRTFPELLILTSVCWTYYLQSVFSIPDPFQSTSYLLHTYWDTLPRVLAHIFCLKFHLWKLFLPEQNASLSMSISLHQPQTDLLFKFCQECLKIMQAFLSSMPLQRFYPMCLPTTCFVSFPQPTFSLCFDNNYL